MADSLAVWKRACHVVLDQSGRARLHDTRAVLNNVALGLEVLRHEMLSNDSTTAPRVIDIMQRDLRAAADELSGLQSLLTTVASEQAVRLATCLEWADTVARPVARRRGVDLIMPSPSAVPVREQDSWLAVALAQALVEASLQTPRGGRCNVQVLPDRDAIEIDWRAAANGAGGDRQTSALLALRPGARGRLETDGDRRTLTVNLSHPT